MDYFSSVGNLPLVGPRYEKLLLKLDIKTIKDILYHFPFRYNDFSSIKKISGLVFADVVSVKGTISEIKNIYTKGGKKFTKLILEDSTGTIVCIFFNQHFLTRTLKKGMDVAISGKVDSFDEKIAFLNPEYEILNAETPQLHTGRIVPVYPETARLSSKWLRKKIYPLLTNQTFNDIDIIPPEFQKQNSLETLSESLPKIHFPEKIEDSDISRKRFEYEELFTAQLDGLIKRDVWKSRGVAKNLNSDAIDLLEFIKKLPFTLTKSQLIVCQEILNDLSKKIPANRLISGDVGSGKTVVVALAMYITAKNLTNSIFMAPTEILANQHFETISKIFSSLNSVADINLVTGKKIQKSQNLNKPSITIGTHAIFYKKEIYKNTGLVVIDEQHRFGVEQREKILSLVSKENTPHIVTMTATPIPRSLCLTLYGDLDISSIKELPPERIPTKTFVVPLEKREKCYLWAKEKIIKEKTQVFVVCPFVEDSQHETLKSVNSAKSLYEELKTKWFNDTSIEVVHGKLNSIKKDEIIRKFQKNLISVLVATPIIEVGIDIPNANIMIIESAERFGLASLHQLRGRVGRGNKQAFCFLISTNDSSNNRRLKELEKTNSGYTLAEKDLEIRGPGQLYGTKQSGKEYFKFANFQNIELLQKTYEDAKYVVTNKDKFPKTIKLLSKFFPGKIAPN